MKDKPFLKLVILWISIAAIVILVKAYITPHLNVEKQPVNVISPKPDERSVVSYTEGSDSAGAISEYDATGDYIFFSYSERTAVVDAYDFDGNFAFRLRFENKENGALSIRCQDDAVRTFLVEDHFYVALRERRVPTHCTGGSLFVHTVRDDHTIYRIERDGSPIVTLKL